MNTSITACEQLKITKTELQLLYRNRAAISVGTFEKRREILRDDLYRLVIRARKSKCYTNRKRSI